MDAVLTTFLNDGVEEVADYDTAGTLLRRYVHGPGVDEYLVMYVGSGTANKSYFHANHQGSIVAMSDGMGNVTEQHSYDSYGNSDDLTGNPFRYTGRRLDEETGLYYYRARYYSPAIGRFLQTDPIGYGDGLNWYAYVQNDPLNKTDPSGNNSVATRAAIGACGGPARGAACGTAGLAGAVIIGLAARHKIITGQIRPVTGIPLPPTSIVNNSDPNDGTAIGTGTVPVPSAPELPESTGEGGERPIFSEPTDPLEGTVTEVRTPTQGLPGPEEDPDNKEPKTTKQKIVDTIRKVVDVIQDLAD